MLLLKLAFRNIFRQKRRSLFTILSIMGSFILCSMAIGLVYGTYGKVINTFTKGHSGHIQIHAKTFLERPSLFKNIKEPDQIEDIIKKNSEIINYSKRVLSSVLISSGEKTSSGKLIGIDPISESKTTTIAQNVEKGKFLDQIGTNEIVISHALSQILNATVGSEIILMTQAADGSMANDKFTVVGIFKEASDSMEARHIYVHLSTIQEFLVLGNRIHEFVLITSNYDHAKKISLALQSELKDFEVSSWEEIESEFYKAMKADQTGIWVDLGIMIFIVSIGVLNTVLMTILERTKEFGILKAIGTRPKDILISVILETTILSLISTSIGTIFALIINYKLSFIGIPYPMPIEIGGMALHHLYGEVSLNNIIIPFIVVTFSSVGVSIIPAIRAAKIVPVKAIRSV